MQLFDKYKLTILCDRYSKIKFARDICFALMNNKFKKIQ